MALFSRNNKEVEKKNIANVIKYEGDNSTFVWKHPCEDFNTMSQLIVHESQEALFMKDGKALDLLTSGRYTLDTQNIPILGKMLNLVTGETPFHCEVYFINKTVQMSIKWGVDSKIRYIDPKLGVPLELGAYGQMNLEVVDSRKLLLKLVGTMNGIAWNNEDNNFAMSLSNAFRPLISSTVKTNLIQSIQSQGLDILDIDGHYDEISTNLKEKMNEGFGEYGLNIPQFYISSISYPEDDENFKKIVELHTASLKEKTIEVEAQLKKTKIKTDAQVEKTEAETQAEVEIAKRQTELEKQTTESEIAKKEVERKVMVAQAEAEITRLSGLANVDVARASGLSDAEIMKAKGYSEKDVLQSDVQKAYAQGIGQVGSHAGGGTVGNSGGSIVNDMLGLGVGLQAAGAMGKQLKGFFNEMNENQNDITLDKTNAFVCKKCGSKLNADSKFCPECGEKVMNENEIVCPGCGKTIVKTKFCPECGYKFVTSCPKCGAQINSGTKFCPECGEKL